MGRSIKWVFIALVILIMAGTFYMMVIKKEPQNSGVQVKTFTTDGLSEDVLNGLDAETQNLAKQYGYNEMFDSFESIDKLKQDDDSYLVPKYNQQPLYLVIATKKADGTIFAIFDDQK